jgi:nicotinamidase-related amidase
VQYFQDSTPAGQPCREENFIRREIDMALPAEQTALVLVDMWNIHFIESWLERAVQVTRDAVVPALEAARDAGLTIVHAPSPPVAAPYPQLQRHRQSESPEPAPPHDWPPTEFCRRAGDYAAFRGPRDQPPGIAVHWDQMKDQLGMTSAIEVRDDDFVIATGQQLHDLARERRILHLVYAGFATNWCILNRDYGMRAMSRRAYNLILLRDSTTGVEFPDTLEGLMATEMAIREVEVQLGFSASNADFLRACRGGS